MRHKILFFSANPAGTSSLELAEEYHAIDDEKERATLRDSFHLEGVFAAQVDDLRRKLDEHSPAVVHFSGHGASRAIDAPRGRGALSPDGTPAGGDDPRAGECVMETPNGKAVTIPILALAEQLRIECEQARDPLPVRCVVLNACHSGRQAEAIAKHVDCAIGTANAVPDEAAIAFSRGFYGKLLDGGSVRDAFDSGKNEIRSKRAGDPEVYELHCHEGVKPENVWFPTTRAPPSGSEREPESVLTDLKALDDFVAASSALVTLVLYHAAWSGHSRAELGELREVLRDPRVRGARFEAVDANVDALWRRNVRAFPTLVAHPRSGEPVTFTGFTDGERLRAAIDGMLK